MTQKPQEKGSPQRLIVNCPLKGRCFLLRIAATLFALGGTLWASGCQESTAAPEQPEPSRQAEAVDGDDSSVAWNYDRKTKTLHITGKGPMRFGQFPFKDLEIKTLVIDEGVTTISPYAFYGHKETSGKLQLPSTLQEIGAFAFSGCEGLAGDLVLPEGVASLGDFAFHSCRGLDGTLTLPRSLETIGEHAFGSCNGLTGSLKFGDRLTTIGRAAFLHCASLSGDLILPDSLVSLGASAFNQCRGLNGKLRLSNGLKEIPYGAFSFCPQTTGDLIIPDSVEKIGDTAFHCSGFDGRLTLGANVKEIGVFAFSSCKLSGELTLPGSLPWVEESAFASCANLTGLKFQEGLKYVSKNAFADCTSLKGELVFPRSLEIVGDHAFIGCRALEGLQFANDRVSIGRSAFKACTSLTGALTFQTGPINIKKEAFEYTKITTEFSIPYSAPLAYAKLPEATPTSLQEMSPRAGAKDASEITPYDWTSALVGKLEGLREFADMSLYLEQKGFVILKKGDRVFSESDYQTSDSEDGKFLLTDALTTPYGVVERLQVKRDAHGTRFLVAQVARPDGEPLEIVFTDGSEEDYPIAVESGTLADAF